jgi:hypothetical protein
MSDHWSWKWISRLTSLGQVGIWAYPAALAIALYVAHSVRRAGQPLGISVTYAILAGAGVVIIVGVAAFIWRLPPRSPQEAASRPFGTPSEEYAVEQARRHEAESRRLAEEAQRVKEQLAAAQQDASEARQQLVDREITAKDAIEKMEYAFSEILRLFQNANKRSEMANKAIADVDGALSRGQMVGLLLSPTPAPERIEQAQQIIWQYRADRVKATDEENAAFLPAKTDKDNKTK